MLKKLLASIFFCAYLMVSCNEREQQQDPLRMVLASDNPKIKRVVDSVAPYEVQIRYTQIDRQNDSVIFTDFDYQVDSSHYFYPASTVKLPIAILALEKLNKIDGMDIDTRFYIEGDSVETTFAKSISAIFAISDNESSNRLFEFLGQDILNNSLEKKEVGPFRIVHRLGLHSDDVTTKPLIVYEDDSTTTIIEGSINTPAKPLNIEGLFKGSAFYDNDSLFHEPFDLSLKNYYPIETQHEVLKRIIFPEHFPPDKRFDLNEKQSRFLLDAMQTLPRAAGYDPDKYYDGYCKFFMFGDSKEHIPEHIKIYNKVGFAFGTLTDCAYISDTKNDIDFLLTATILVNKNTIFNDDIYEYDSVGIPFLAELGRQLYTYERNRKKE